MTELQQRRRALKILLAGAGALATGAVRAQDIGDYPNRAVKMIVPYLAGGGADIAARIVGQGLAKLWKQPVVVENLPGAGSNVGLEVGAKSAPDGYTLIVCGSPITANPFLYKRTGYDPLTSFETVTMHYTDVNILVVPPDGFNSVAELIAAAKAKPDALSYASSGNGTSTHLAAELFKSMAGVKIVHVPYKGVPPALADVMGGRVPMMFANAGAVTTLVNSGKLKGIAVSSSKRIPQFPQLPTIAEAALPGYEATTWSGFLFPAGTPPAIVAKVYRDIVSVLNEPATKQALESRGFTIVGNAPEEFKQVMKDELVKWGALIKATGASLD
jgi:tripartite-type tricarboxylate transporter receptor subunit TctC